MCKLSPLLVEFISALYYSHICIFAHSHICTFLLSSTNAEEFFLLVGRETIVARAVNFVEDFVHASLFLFGTHVVFVVAFACGGVVGVACFILFEDTL